MKGDISLVKFLCSGENGDVMGIRDKKIYFVLLLLFGGCFALLCVLVFMAEMEPNEGQYILPGNALIEGLYILVVPWLVLGSGVLAIKYLTPFFVKLYLRGLKIEQNVGRVPPREVTGSRKFLHLLGRATLLAFFILNICHTLVSQEIIVELLRAPDLSTPYQIPDASTMYNIMFVFAIPCTLLIVPVWVMNDLGLVVVKPSSRAEFSRIDLASGTLYKIIKGYAGLGFLYNLAVLVIVWTLQSDATVQFFLVMQLISPGVAVACMFPLVVFLDAKRTRYLRYHEKTLQDLGLTRRLEISVEFISSNPKGEEGV